MKKIIIYSLILLIPIVLTGRVALADSSSISFPNPLTVSTETDLLNSVLNSLQSVIVVLAIIAIVIGGIMYMTSFGNDAAMKRAKTVLTAAMIGLAIALSAKTFLQEIWNILGVGSSVSSPGGSSFKTIAENTLTLLLSLIGVIGIIGMITGGIMYMTAYGDEDRVKTGKRILVASIIGIVIALSAVIIVKQIGGIIEVS